MLILFIVLRIQLLNPLKMHPNSKNRMQSCLVGPMPVYTGDIRKNPVYPTCFFKLDLRKTAENEVSKT